VKKMIGAMSIVIKLMKVLLINCAVDANDGQYKPTIMPKTIAVNTWKVRLENTRFIVNNNTIM